MAVEWVFSSANASRSFFADEKSFFHFLLIFCCRLENTRHGSPHSSSVEWRGADENKPENKIIKFPLVNMHILIYFFSLILPPTADVFILFSGSISHFAIIEFKISAGTTPSFIISQFAVLTIIPITQFKLVILYFRCITLCWSWKWKDSLMKRKFIMKFRWDGHWVRGTCWILKALVQASRTFIFIFS